MQVVDLINQEKWTEAFAAFDNLLNGDLSGYPSFFANTTGYHYYFNYLHSQEPADFEYRPPAIINIALNS